MFLPLGFAVLSPTCGPLVVGAALAAKRCHSQCIHHGHGVLLREYALRERGGISYENRVLRRLTHQCPGVTMGARLTLSYRDQGR
ncbi:hypothetical protein D9M68_608900 [compost metagenome]